MKTIFKLFMSENRVIMYYEIKLIIINIINCICKVIFMYKICRVIGINLFIRRTELHH